MDPLKKEDFLKLIERYRAKTATPEEIQFLHAYYRSFELRDGYSDTLDEAGLTALRENLYNGVENRIASPGRRQPPVIRVIRYWPRVAAAVLLIALSVSAVVYVHQKHKVQQVAQSPIKPGSNKAVLTLGNGQKISLTDASTGQLAQQPGLHINKTANGQVVYTVSGDTKTGKAALQYNTIEVPAGGQWQVVLADGSRVWLNSLSSITFPTAFTGSERSVDIKGEAYFEIAPRRSQPFTVHSLGQTIEVLGTHFNVMAYPDEKVMKTTLLQGSVKISDGETSVLLKPGEEAQVASGGIKVSSNPDAADAVAWKNGYFHFNDNLESAMNKIARWYNVEIVYEGRPDNSILFGGEISRTRDIRDVLNIMAYTGKVHFDIKGRTIIVKQ